MSKDLYVIAEQRDGEIAKVTLELLGEATILAADLGEKVYAVLMGDQIKDKAQSLIEAGADGVIVIEDPMLKEYVTEPYAKALTAMIKKYDPNIVLFGATSIGRDIAPRVAARVHTGLTADCTHLDINMNKYFEFLKATSTADTDSIEKKLGKLGKYFSDEINANVKLSSEGSRDKIEATISNKGTIFRAEEAGNDIYDSIDRIVDKLSNQMSRFKTKLQRKHKDNKDVFFAELPEMDETEKEIDIVRTKKFQLEPMNAEEAIMQMELLGHNFFVFLDMETDSVNVVYRRKNNSYGLLETTY